MSFLAADGMLLRVQLRGAEGGAPVVVPATAEAEVATAVVPALPIEQHA